MMARAYDRIKFPQGFWEGLNQLGISAPDIARQARLPLAVITEPVVTAAQYFAIWQAYNDYIGDTAGAIVKLVNVFATAQYPPAALAPYHARDYRDALIRMTRYKKLCPPENLRISENGDYGTVELTWQHAEQSGPPILVGITLAYLLELGRRGTGKPLAARSVEFSHPMGDMHALEAYFGCRIRTGAQGNRLTLHRRDLDCPFVSYNEELLEMLTPILDRSLDEQQRGGPIIEKVKWILKRNLTGGCLDIRTVASELRMSDRTLQRRLTDEGTSFKHVLAQSRHEQALEYLADPSLSIKEVAFLLGYEDQNSFYRAFRVWAGDTPSSWRARHHDTG